MPEETKTDAAAARHQALARAKEWLVHEGEEIGRKAAKNRDWRGQGRVLWEAARTETEPAVLLNLLRYQAARNPNWVTEEDVLAPTEAALTRAIREAGADKDLAMELIQHLLVYTLRAHRHEEWRRKAEEKTAKKRERREAGGGRS
jgi:hypothetical protein